MAEEDVLKRLDMIQATLALAFSREISETRDRIRADPINAAILDHAGDWIQSPVLQRTVANIVKKSERSVRDRFPDLLAQRVLESRGSEMRQEYRRTGLI